MEPTFQQILEQHLGIFLVAIFLSLITIFIAWYKRFFRLPEYDRSSLQVRLIQVLWAFLIYFGISILVPFILIQIIRTFPDSVKANWSLEIDATRAWINLINITILFICIAIYVSAIRRESRHTVLGENFYRGTGANVGHFFMGVLTWLISFPIVLAVSQAFSILILYFNLSSQEQVAVRFLKSTMENPVLFLITSLFVIFIVPTIEELLFRGFLQNWIARFLSRGWAIFLTALIFSGFHFSMSQGWGNLEILPSLFTLALFLGFIYFRQKSICASIGLHATFNAVNIFLMSQAATS